MNDVIESCKYHQHQDDRETDTKADLLRPVRQWTPPQRFDGIEQKVTAIEQGNRKQVQEPDGDRNYGGDVDQKGKTYGCSLADNTCNANRAAKLIS
jgi:hypothetical protein